MPPASTTARSTADFLAKQAQGRGKLPKNLCLRQAQRLRLWNPRFFEKNRVKLSGTAFAEPPLFFMCKKRTLSTAKEKRSQSVEKVKICRRRRICADDGDTDREILRQIVREKHSDECAICRKILSKGITQGETDALGDCRARLLPLVQRVEKLDTLRMPFPAGGRRSVYTDLFVDDLILLQQLHPSLSDLHGRCRVVIGRMAHLFLVLPDAAGPRHRQKIRVLFQIRIPSLQTLRG